MRLAWIVSYDIADAKRLRRVHRKMRGYGDALQYSVFRCELSSAEKARLLSELHGLLNHAEDQILLVPLGPPGGTNDGRIEALGRPYVDRDRAAIVVIE